MLTKESADRGGDKNPVYKNSQILYITLNPLVGVTTTVSYLNQTPRLSELWRGVFLQIYGKFYERQDDMDVYKEHYDQTHAHHNSYPERNPFITHFGHIIL